VKSSPRATPLRSPSDFPNGQSALALEAWRAGEAPDRHSASNVGLPLLRRATCGRYATEAPPAYGREPASARQLRERRYSRSMSFHARLLRVPHAARDAWVDEAFGLGELSHDGPDLPRGCVPYLPCPVDTLLHVVERTPVGPSDVFVDVGSGLGRAAALVHLLTGASAVGLEIQPELVVAARDLARRLGISRVSFVEGDAAQLTAELGAGSVFFLYCPFSGERLTKVLAALELVARTKTIHVCAVDLPLPACDWLTLQEEVPPGSLAIHRSSRA